MLPSSGNFRRFLTLGITRRAHNVMTAKFTMKAALFAVGCMPLLCGSSSLCRDERDLFL